jgi:quinoprotein glucose dehydrogenase
VDAKTSLDKNGKKGVLTVPHNQGAANWESAAGDPETGYLFVPSITNWWNNALVCPTPAAGAPPLDERCGGKGGSIPGPMGLPLLKGPWGRITAINLNTGEHAWMVPNGSTLQSVRDNPALKGVDIPNEGNPERSPLLVTKTLLFSGDGAGLFSSGPGGGGPKFRALDKKTGKTIYEMTLPANTTGLPMTYMMNGRQYIVIAVGARGVAAELVALALPVQR